MARNTSVTLGEHYDAFIAEKIKTGRYQSISEVVRAGLRRLEEDEIKLHALREKLRDGEASPLVTNFDGREFLKQLHEKHQK